MYEYLGASQKSKAERQSKNLDPLNFDLKLQL